MVDSLPEVHDETCFPRQNREGIAHNPEQNHALLSWLALGPIVVIEKQSVAENLGGPDRQVGLSPSPLQGKENIWFLSLGLSKTIFTVEYNFLLPDSISNLIGGNVSEMQFSLWLQWYCKEKQGFYGETLLYLDKPYMTNKLSNTLSINWTAFNYLVIDLFSSCFSWNPNNSWEVSLIVQIPLPYFLKISHSL